MSQKIRFTKMHGLGNDYIYVDATRYHIPNPSEAARRWSRHHFGIGSDGLVLIGRPSTADADFSMRLFNADGSEALMCGNASRCIGKYVYERGLTAKKTVRLLTLSGVKTLHLEVDASGTVSRVTVDMLEPSLSDERLFLGADASLPEGVFVSMGNPHYVIFVDDLDSVDVATIGPELECHRCFPERCSIEWVEVRPAGLRMRVWERGSGVTLACGTGACAAVVAAALTGRCRRSARVAMDGGEVTVEWRESDNRVYLTGPATTVYDGEIPLPQ